MSFSGFSLTLSPLPCPTDTGANASAEEADEGLEDTAVRVNNIVHSFRLQNTSFDKKGYLSYLKGYLKAVKAALQEAGKSDEEVKTFETGAQKFVKETLLPNFKDFEFYTGESMNPDGLYVPPLPCRTTFLPPGKPVFDTNFLGSSCSTTARTAPRRISLSGSTA